ncbi:MAG: hypothetical protein KGL39_03795 [Patescibacteria group bacterium]|nr:hypothetical protein [Patescibacteria group bacterium]
MSVLFALSLAIQTLFVPAAQIVSKANAHVAHVVSTSSPIPDSMQARPAHPAHR